MLDFNDEQFIEIDPDINNFNNNLGKCSMYTIDEFTNIVSDNYFTLMNFNIRSFHRNNQSLNAFLNSFSNNNLHAIVLSETWNSNATVDLCSIEGYNSFHTYRQSSRGGGISIFTLNIFKSLKIDDISWCTENIESCVVKLFCDYEPIFIIGIYRPPKSSIENFFSDLENLLNNDLLRNKFLIFAGDINIDLLNVNVQDTINYINLMFSFHLLPVIDCITRYSNNESGFSGTNLDHIFMNKLIPYSSGVICLDITDHFPTFVQMKINLNDKIECGYTQKIIFRNYSDDNLNLFAEKLSLMNWDFINTNVCVNFAFENFLKTISDLYCNLFPVKTKYLTANRLNKPWITKELLKLIKLKSEYVRLFKLGVISKESNNKFKNYVTTIIRKAEHSYYLDKFKNFRKNMKTSWNILRDLSGNKISKKLSNRIFTSDVYEDNLAQVENFNKFFANVGKFLDGKINHSYFQPSFSYPNSFFFHPVTDAEIEKIITNLKPVHSDINTIPIKIFKKLKYLFIYPLKMLINLSFEKGVFPDCLKLARITPIFKQGDHLDPSNYRPISCLPYVSKIIEKCVKERLMKFCNKYNLINISQFGFQCGKSTCDALIHLTEIIYRALNDKNNLLTVMIDFKKAFDTVNHQILLKKLECYGIRATQLKWFSSYLFNRRCYVEIDKIKSSVECMNIGVPQGSILGPILFLFYINDISSVSNIFSTTLFADDTTISISDPSFNNLINSSNHELSNLSTWTLQNRLTLNVNKTVSLYFSNKKTLNIDQQIVLGGEIVKNVDSAKFLGVYLDSNLNFVPHIKYICGKISKHLGILFKIRDKLTLEAKLSYYYAFVYPYLSYNVCVWGSTYPTHLNPLIILQKRIVRLMTNSSYLAHTRPLFSKLGILQFNDIYKFNLLSSVHKSISRNILVFNNCRNSRDSFLIKPVFHRLSKTQHSFSFTGPTEWNRLPLYLRKIEKFNHFKKSLKSYFLNSYTD